MTPTLEGRGKRDVCIKVQDKINEREREMYLGRRGVGGALDWQDPRNGLSGTA